MERQNFKLWLCHISAELINSCLSLNIENCPGCRDGILSPILHFHTSFSLKDVIEKYFDIALKKMDVEYLSEKFCTKLNLRDEQSYDRLIKVGKSFLETLTAKALYYGDYITVENDKIVSELIVMDISDNDNTSEFTSIPERYPSEPAPKKRRIQQKPKCDVKEESSYHKNDVMSNKTIVLPEEEYNPSSPSYEPTPIKQKVSTKKKVNNKEMITQKDVQKALNVRQI